MLNTETIEILKGPYIGDGMLFITINLIAFLVSLLFILRVPSGKIAKPLTFIALGFFTSATAVIALGIEYLFLAPLLQSLFTLCGIMGLMRALGIFNLISGKIK